MANSPHFSSDAGFSLFARDFDDPSTLDGVIVLDEPELTPPASEPEIQAISLAMLEEARACAHAEGLRQGRAEAAAARDAAREAMVTQLLFDLRNADINLRQAVEAAGTQLANLALAVIEAGFPSLRGCHGAAELSRFSREVIALLDEELRIVVRIHPTMQSVLDEVLADLEEERRAAIIVETRDALPAGDARIAWRNGLATRDTESLRTRIAEALAPLGLAPYRVNLADPDPVRAHASSHT
jgi:flagellar biosynthesis/type III secretory pathway protein FliH